VDVDASGKLNLPELRKLLRMYRENEVKQLKTVFAECCDEDADTLTREQAYECLQQMGVEIGENLSNSPQSLEQEFASGAVDLMTILRIVEKGTKDSQKACNENCGFSLKEISEIHQLFCQYDKDGSGDIQKSELIHLIEDFFPDMAHNKAMRPKLLQIMASVDADKSGTLDIQDFQRLMQLLRDLQDQAKINKEQAVTKDTIFTAHEIEEFRDLFLARDHGSGHLSIDDVFEMIDNITPLGDRYLPDFLALFSKVTLKKEGLRKTSKLVADFPEFLMLMQQILESNFARVKDRVPTNRKLTATLRSLDCQ